MLFELVLGIFSSEGCECYAYVGDAVALLLGGLHECKVESNLFSQGSRFGGHALYLKDRKLRYVYNWVGELVQVIESDETVPAGHVVLSASFDREGDSMPVQGTLSLYIRDRKIGEGKIRTQPGKFGLGGGGLVVGRSGAEPVIDDYPGERPWAFTGGTIKRVVIDVSGEAFEDLAMEARAAFARQ